MSAGEIITFTTCGLAIVCLLGAWLEIRVQRDKTKAEALANALSYEPRNIEAQTGQQAGAGGGPMPTMTGGAGGNGIFPRAVVANSAWCAKVTDGV